MGEGVSTYIVVLSFLATGALFLAMTFGISKILRPNKPDASKLSTYECGEEAVGAGQIQFNSRFFVIALLFVLFEVELIFLFPWAIAISDQSQGSEAHNPWNLLALIEVVLFVAVLGLGLVYAWAKGHLDWLKPVTKPTEHYSKIPTEAYEKFL